MNNLRIIFMGTPDFAVPSLEILLENQFNIVAVITAPDKPQGRGLIVRPSPVKAFALQHHLPVLQPPNLKDPSFVDKLKSFEANLQVVVAFRMLPEAVWSMPTLGTFNLHASLLPQYRGAAPINWAIIHGETETGVTTFFIRHEIDTGNIIFQEKEPIYPDDDAGSLYERLKHKGARLVLKTVQAIAAGQCPSHPQPQIPNLRTAPKITREICKINWNQPARQIVNLIRGLSPHPAAWTLLEGKTYKLFKAVTTNHDRPMSVPGTLETNNKDYLYVQAADGWISVKELQAEGKKRMTVEEFFRGNKLSANSAP
jgi:methionyl-tRNA formyltransferase